LASCFLGKATLVSLERPDREYVDGEIRERNAGKYELARIQALRAHWFGNHEQEWGAQAVTEQRVRVSPSRIRIPDVALLPLGAQPDVIADPPLLVIEILSPEDTYSDT
jgi:Uma2 family endonuclease